MKKGKHDYFFTARASSIIWYAIHPAPIVEFRYNSRSGNLYYKSYPMRYERYNNNGQLIRNLPYGEPEFEKILKIIERRKKLRKYNKQLDKV